MQRWQGQPILGQGLVTFVITQDLQGLRGDPGAARRAEKSNDLRHVQGLPGHRRTAWQRHRFDAHQLQALIVMPLEREACLQHWRHRPTRAAQTDKHLLREGRAIRCAQTGLGFATDQLAGTGVTFPRLTVQRLHAGQQAGRQPQSGQHAEKLHRVLTPMAEQGV